MSQLSTPAVLVDEDPRYPIGRFIRPTIVTESDRCYAVANLAELPTHLRNAVEDLDEDQLSTPYREGGWTVRQLVHHIADSHSNAILRVRKALTEDWPTIATYDEKAWAQMPDCLGPVEWSLALTEAMHARWVMLLQSLADEQWQRGFVHPVQGRYTVEQSTLVYAWHSRHHIAHITHLRAREDW